jgi:hypothetical protein
MAGSMCEGEAPALEGRERNSRKRATSTHCPERAGETPAVPAPYNHFIHLNKKYGSTAASSIRARANG